MQCARSAAVKIAALTDFMPHAYWPLRNVDLYCLATAEAVATFEQRGVDTSCLAMTGIPVSHAFTQSRSKEDARRRLSLPNDRVVALVVAGARQSGPYATMVKGLLADCRHDDFGGATLVVLTGENRILRNHLESLGRSDLFAVGYTSEVADYMAAADLLFCKPGGVSLAECLTQGRPLILWGSGHGQERANSSLLVSKGAVALMGSREPVGHWIRKLTNDPTAFDDMCARSMALARPDAAATIADLVLTRIGGRRIHVDEGPSANTARYQHLHGSRSR
jgi:processive 1,2-diacylglycerol beta-glucosyltransferase